ncbi:MAG: hypothetical protein R3D98_08650 [Candidatus Krumholzibacteriia bacterium]
MSIMDQVKKTLREWYALAADRTGDMAKISVRMYDKYGISREIERQLSELGSYVYHAVDEGRTDFAGDEAFLAAVTRVKELEQDLDAKVTEIEEIRLQRQQRQAAREQAQADDADAYEDTAPLDSPEPEPASAAEWGDDPQPSASVGPDAMQAGGEADGSAADQPRP